MRLLKEFVQYAYYVAAQLGGSSVGEMSRKD